jgi:hypothetical protein
MVMERAAIEVSALVWDERNEAKLAAHGVTPEDIENVLANAPRFFVNLPERTAEFIIIGPDFEGRFYYVPIVPTHEAGVWYVVTAFPVNRRRALRVYKNE